MDDDKHTLLVCTVGGSPEPIVATLKRWTPLRVWFVPTRETRPQIESAVIPLAGSEGLALDPACTTCSSCRTGRASRPA